MRVTTVPMVMIGCLALSACGSTGGRSAAALRPPTPVNLSVYVDDSRISVSPGSAGAGPIVFIVTNQASQAESLAISRAGGGASLASTAPINPQGTTQVTVNVPPGDYTVGIATHGSTDAQLSEQSSIQPASIHVGRPRGNSSSQLLTP
jgi:hypothetical protein